MKKPKPISYWCNDCWTELDYFNEQYKKCNSCKKIWSKEKWIEEYDPFEMDKWIEEYGEEE